MSQYCCLKVHPEAPLLNHPALSGISGHEWGGTRSRSPAGHSSFCVLFLWPRLKGQKLILESSSHGDGGSHAAEVQQGMSTSPPLRVLLALTLHLLNKVTIQVQSQTGRYSLAPEGGTAKFYSKEHGCFQ